MDHTMRVANSFLKERVGFFEERRNEKFVPSLCTMISKEQWPQLVDEAFTT